MQPEAFAARYGALGARVAPLVGAEPQINVNAATGEVLAVVLSYPALGIRDPAGAAYALAAAASARAGSGGLAAAGIPELLGVAPDHAVRAWIGSRTWFWRVLAEVDGRGFRAIVRMGEGAEGPRAILVEFGLHSGIGAAAREEGDDRPALVD